MKLEERIRLFRGTRFLQAAEEAVLAELAGQAEEVSLEQGQLLMQVGEPGDALYVVASGRLEIFVDQAVLDHSSRGDCLGEMALVTDEPRSASVRACEASRVLKLTQETFREAVSRHPSLAWGVIRELAAKVKSSIRVRVEQHQFAVRLEEAFARSVSHAVLQRVMGTHNPGDLLKGGSSQVTTLFAGVRGFSTLASKLEPDQLIKLLNEYLSGMVEVILENGGTLDRFVGDGILAHFGIPLPDTRDASRAMRCAVQMQEALTRLNEGGELLARHPLQVGIGLATGTVVAGYVGTGRRMEYTAIGEVVALANDVERLTRIYRSSTLMCDETARQLGSELLLREVDRVGLKGRLRPTHVYDILTSLEDATPSTVRLLSEYRRAFALYASGHFQQAAVLFDALSLEFPLDGPTLAMGERCRRFAVQPPSRWDCIYYPGTEL